MENSHFPMLDLCPLETAVCKQLGWSLLIWETVEEGHNSHTLPLLWTICSAEYSQAEGHPVVPGYTAQLAPYS